MKGKRRGIDKVVRGRRQPVFAEAVWTVTAREVGGSPLKAEFFSEDQAKRHADWWHAHPGLVGTELEGPAYDGPKVPPTAADEAIGEWLAESLDSAKVPPSVKYNIHRWLDSKSWESLLKEVTA